MCFCSYCFIKLNIIDFSVSFFLRVKGYIAGGLHDKIKNPGGGIHLARVKAGLGLLEEINARTLKENFPSDGFTEDLSILPFISFGTIWRYMIDESDAKKQLSTAKTLVMGYNFLNLVMFLQSNVENMMGSFM